MRHWIPVTLVLAVHAAALALMVHARASQPQAEPVVMQVVMVPPTLEPPAPAPEPEPTPPLPTPPKPPEPRPQPKPVRDIPTPNPVPPAPQPEVVAAAEPPPVPAPAQTPVPAVAEPVTVPPKVDASYRGNRFPSYPPLSRRLNEQGTVILDVQVQADGRVGDIQLSRSSGYSRLDDAAVAAVKRWKFSPATRAGLPVAARYKLPVEFDLKKAEK